MHLFFNEIVLAVGYVLLEFLHIEWLCACVHAGKNGKNVANPIDSQLAINYHCCFDSFGQFNDGIKTLLTYCKLHHIQLMFSF